MRSAAQQNRVPGRTAQRHVAQNRPARALDAQMVHQQTHERIGSPSADQVQSFGEDLGEVRMEAETHVGLILLPVPFDDALAACIGSVRALHGPVCVNEGDLRRPQVIGAENRARALAHNLPLAFDLPGTLVIEAGPRLTVIDDFLQSGLSHVLSALFPEALVLTLKHMQEGKTRTERSLMMRQGPDLVRFAGVYRNVTKRGWDWDEEG